MTRKEEKKEMFNNCINDVSILFEISYIFSRILAFFAVKKNLKGVYDEEDIFGCIDFYRA